MIDNETRKEAAGEGDDVQSLTGEPVGPTRMRLRADAPRVTRLSRKVLAGIGLVACLGLGGAFIYALQTRNSGKSATELYSTDNRTTADGLAGLPRDYTGPRLGPPLPGDLGRPILNAQNGGQTIPNPGMAVPNPGISAEEQRRLQELDAARTSRLFSGTETRTASGVATASALTNPPALPDLTSLGLAPQPATPSAQDRQLAFLNAAPDKRTVSPASRSHRFINWRSSCSPKPSRPTPSFLRKARRVCSWRS